MAASPAQAEYPDSFWRSLHHLNRFRGFLALLFLLVPLYGESHLLGQANPRLFLVAGILYAAVAWLFGRLLRIRRPAFSRHLVLHVATDVGFLTGVMALSGGNASGIGLLLIVPMAAAGLHPQLRMQLFMAALGTLAVLVEQTLQMLWWDGTPAGFMRAGLLAGGFFTVSGFSRVLGKSTLSSAQLAGEKAAQAESLAKVNARVIQELQDGVLVVDGQGRVIQHNQRAEALLSCRVFLNASLAHCAPALDGLWRDWRARGTVPDTPFAAGRDGHRVRARFSELEPTRAAGAVILLQDMTELEREAQNLKLASLGRLTANLAHEIRNPLAAIHQAAALLGEEPSTPTMARLTRIIDDNTRRLNGLVEDVLSLNRRDRMQPEAIAVADFLRDFVTQFEQAERIPAGVITLTAPEQLRIRFDRLHLGQILWNLIRNAWRHCTRHPGSIQLRAIADDGRAHIEVFNNGEPISREMQQRLFEPFHTTDTRGTGLGLYIARELADANGGSLRYVDQTGGAMFRVSAMEASEAA
ncbi:MAG: HAMP domain-containing histidine kinase [Thiobacillaceae bacterium]|jgi:two-component system sensor histidine kinase PilS (NtrC family)|nr:HAMP domain-containing histidine kinase [Thiobacillaceae bacterium]